MSLFETKVDLRSSAAKEDFFTFINKKRDFIDAHSLISFAYPIKNINLKSIIHIIQEKFPNFIFIKRPQKNYSFIATDPLVNLEFDQINFTQLEPTIAKLNSSLISNWSDYKLVNVPFITGGTKFNTKSNSDEWIDFNTFHFFIPGIIFLRDGDKSFAISNHKISSSLDEERILKEFLEVISFTKSLEENKNGKYHSALGASKLLKNNKVQWEDSVNNSLKQLNSDFTKVVLSRRIEVETKNGMDWHTCFEKLESENTNGYLFLFKSKDSAFFGASPEKFLSIHSNKLEIDALAGTSSCESKAAEEELLNNKNLHEHRIVIDFIRTALSGFASKIEIDKQPRIKKLRNVNHLYTKIDAELNSHKDVLKLIDALFPTPAVCGLPKQRAYQAISELEKFDRGLFSGLIGWIDPFMNCEFTVAIRSALYKNHKLFLYAGAGIVKESNPEEEFFETELKFKTILNLFDE